MHICANDAKTGFVFRPWIEGGDGKYSLPWQAVAGTQAEVVIAWTREQPLERRVMYGRFALGGGGVLVRNYTATCTRFALRGFRMHNLVMRFRHRQRVSGLQLQDTLQVVQLAISQNQVET